MKIIKMYLKNGVKYFDPPANTNKVKQILNANKEGIYQWYLDFPDNIRDVVFKKPSKEHSIIRYGFFIAEDKDVIITSANINTKTKRYRAPCVVAKRYISKVEKLIETKQKATLGNACIIYWHDAIVNFGLGTIDEITNKSHIAEAARIGILLKQNKKETYVSPHHNEDHDKYREVLVVPTKNITKIVKLKKQE